MRDAQSKETGFVAPIAGGIALASLTFCLGALIAMPGHGWYVPTVLGMAGFLLYPAAAVSRSAGSMIGRTGETVIVLLALAAAIWIFESALDREFTAYNASGDPVLVDKLPVYFWTGGIAVAGIAGALLLRRLRGAVAAISLLAVALLSLLAIICNMMFQDGPWGYQGHIFQIFWFVLWALWPLMAVAGLAAAFEDSDTAEEVFE